MWNVTRIEHDIFLLACVWTHASLEQLDNRGRFSFLQHDDQAINTSSRSTCLQWQIEGRILTRATCRVCDENPQWFRVLHHCRRRRRLFVMWKRNLLPHRFLFQVTQSYDDPDCPVRSGTKNGQCDGHNWLRFAHSAFLRKFCSVWMKVIFVAPPEWKHSVWSWKTELVQSFCEWSTWIVHVTRLKIWTRFSRYVSTLQCSHFASMIFPCTSHTLSPPEKKKPHEQSLKFHHGHWRQISWAVLESFRRQKAHEHSLETKERISVKNDIKQQFELCLNIVESHKDKNIHQTIENGILSSTFSEFFGVPPNYLEFFKLPWVPPNSSDLLEIFGVLGLFARHVDDRPVEQNVVFPRNSYPRAFRTGCRFVAFLHRLEPVNCTMQVPVDNRLKSNNKPHSIKSHSIKFGATSDSSKPSICLRFSMMNSRAKCEISLLISSCSAS